MVFSPSNYLRGLGWSGPGTSLQPDNIHARVKPITVPQKKTLAGVGKDRDTAYPWWEMVFANVANKVSGVDKTDHHRTTTGIISPLPPPKRTYNPLPSSSLSSSSTPPPVVGGGMNQSALADAKMEAARRQLYSGFLRGAAMGQTLDMEREEEERIDREKREKRQLEEDTAEKLQEGEELSKEDKRAAKRRRKQESQVAEVVATTQEGNVCEKKEKKGTKEERVAAKLLRREARAGSSVSASTSALPTPIVSDTETPLLATSSQKSKKSQSTVEDETVLDEDYVAAKLAAKMERKLEKKAAKLASQSRKDPEEEESEGKKTKRKRS